ncbi:hypothetical protein [Dapis sp. BLCC M172]|uniref:hypothetical protein n=1 Tax=Dapis sp. BLCC M172 TaxID=2975281 RepID=UPI003CF5F827
MLVKLEFLKIYTATPKKVMHLIQLCKSLLQLDFQFVQLSNSLMGSAIYTLKLKNKSAFQLFERGCFNLLKKFDYAEIQDF